jgi:hypothetical protein
MNYCKPSAKLSANSVAETPAFSEQENTTDLIAAASNPVFAIPEGPKDLLFEESDDLIRNRIKNILPMYLAPKELKEKIRRISSLGRD